MDIAALDEWDREKISKPVENFSLSESYSFEQKNQIFLPSKNNTPDTFN